MSTHIPYEVYSNLLDQDYQLGKSDCFTIINSVLDQSFGIKMPNYARPEGFHRDELNLMPRIAAEPFLHHRPALDIKDLQAGDILCLVTRYQLEATFGHEAEARMVRTNVWKVYQVPSINTKLMLQLRRLGDSPVVKFPPRAYYPPEFGNINI